MASSGGSWFTTTSMTKSGKQKRSVFAKAGETANSAIRRAKKEGLKGRKLRKAKF